VVASVVVRPARFIAVFAAMPWQPGCEATRPGGPPASRTAKLSYTADLLSGFSRRGVKSNIPVTMFPQKDFICDG
jgi:hypothetical protein